VEGILHEKLRSDCEGTGGFRIGANFKYGSSIMEKSTFLSVRGLGMGERLAIHDNTISYQVIAVHVISPGP
jgi:hypothetical protein